MPDERLEFGVFGANHEVAVFQQDEADEVRRQRLQGKSYSRPGKQFEIAVCGKVVSGLPKPGGSAGRCGSRVEFHADAG